MPSPASGEIHTTGAASLAGNFTTDNETPYAIFITTDNTIDPFKVVNATLTYTKETDMTSHVTVNGTTGEKVNITCTRDRISTVITGKVTGAGIDPPITIVGSGKWSLRTNAEGSVLCPPGGAGTMKLMQSVSGSNLLVLLHPIELVTILHKIVHLAQHLRGQDNVKMPLRVKFESQQAEWMSTLPITRSDLVGGIARTSPRSYVSIAADWTADPSRLLRAGVGRRSTRKGLIGSELHVGKGLSSRECTE
ncbi:uncharacterized protein PHACADRAFT_32175 [Phanerochaete carnosa HHB-10118-sp]|uniref:Uncharacterized protein n=1 Tax=Phanerochaete carnosa (strain HHB-10118-sp) TaxID=650164 RepID=K5UN51_PHACS|nr:uncharacterized protein PHACADRAFT_32175 [Phanerochaete carnosa HHB-10118-sp]EKM51161.1 hypothetical protein PHACADRAFT_32175 [Phanerochaete carnosa HHB-10118-sp]